MSAPRADGVGCESDLSDATRDSSPARIASRAPEPSRAWAFSASLFFLGVGLVLRFVQYFGNASQWLDEVKLSVSIVERPLPILLTTPLWHNQSAPPGLLLAQRLAVVAVGPSDLALRFFPFLCGIITLITCFRISQLALRGSARPIAMALVATATPLVAISGQAKQYSSDVATAALIVLLVLETQRRKSTRSWAGLLALAGVAAVFMSNAAPLVLVGASLALFSSARARRGGQLGPELAQLLPVLLVWATFSALSLAWARASVSLAQRQYLHTYWSAGFMPLPPWRLAALKWPFQVFSRLFGGVESAGLWYPFSRGYALVCGLGFFSLWRRDRRVAQVLLAPFATTFLAAVAQQYPFQDRLVLFLVPAALLAVAEGIAWIAGLLSRYAQSLGLAAALVLAAPPLYPLAASLPPYRVEDIKPVLQHLRAASQPADRIYVYYGAAIAFNYYAPRYGFEPKSLLLGSCHYGDPRRNLEELDRLRGNARVWVLISHALPFYDEPRDILAYLDTIGVRRDELTAPSRTPAGSTAWAVTAQLYLFDLSDPARLARSSAATFPVHGESAHLANFSCG